MTARDIYSFMILSNQLQIHENAIEIGQNLKQEFKSVLPRVWPSTYLNQFLIQPHPHFSAAVNIYLNLIESL